MSRRNATMAKTDFWRKTMWIWPAIFIATLLFSAVMTWIENDLTAGELWCVGVLTIVLAVCQIVILYYSFRFIDVDWSLPPFVELVYLMGAIVLWFVLAFLEPGFHIVLAGLIPQIFSYIQFRRAIPIFVVLAAMVTYLQIRGSDVAFLSLNSPALWSLLLFTAGGIVLAYFISGIIGQNVKRRELIEQKDLAIELMRKNRELEEAYLQQEITIRQNEKLATLGKLSAGVAHELNNPAAASQRAVEHLRDSLQKLEQAKFRLGQLNLSAWQLEALESHSQRIYQRAKQPIFLEPLTRSDQEYEIESWLEDNGVEDAWEFAPMLTNIGYASPELSELANNFTNEKFPLVVALLSHIYTTRNLLEEIGQGTGRIVEIVKALKSYSYLDQAPLQSIDIHEGLNDTLVMLRNKLKAGVQVQREYAKELPRIEAFGNELNQVWTNIIDNAIGAMDGQGEIVLKTYQENSWVVAEITDTGSGIPQEIQEKIFDPFFTTKPLGEGTGLGLNISHNIIVQKHKGKITVDSRPGQTRFTVRLPLNFENPQL